MWISSTCSSSELSNCLQTIWLVVVPIRIGEIQFMPVCGIYCYFRISWNQITSKSKSMFKLIERKILHFFWATVVAKYIVSVRFWLWTAIHWCEIGWSECREGCGHCFRFRILKHWGSVCNCSVFINKWLKAKAMRERVDEFSFNGFVQLNALKVRRLNESSEIMWYANTHLAKNWIVCLLIMIIVRNINSFFANCS